VSVSLAERIRSTATVEEIDEELNRLHGELATVQEEIDFLKTTRRILSGDKPVKPVKRSAISHQPSAKTYTAPGPGVALVDDIESPTGQRPEVLQLIKALKAGPRNQTSGQLAVKIARTEAETLATLKGHKDVFTVYAGAWRIR
jgi:predicted HicB family RNase H-like nuclease